MNDKDYRPESLKQWLTDLSKANVSLNDESIQNLVDQCMQKLA